MLNNTQSFAYLLSPYSHPDPKVREQRYKKALQATNKLYKKGIAVFSPIVHWHQQTKLYDLPYTVDAWQSINDPFLKLCDRGIVLAIPGWKHSKGIKDEIAILEADGKPIEYLEMSQTSRAYHNPELRHPVIDKIVMLAKITYEDLASDSRVRPLPDLRAIATYLLYNKHAMTYKQIKQFIPRDHSTMCTSRTNVAHALKQYNVLGISSFISDFYNLYQKVENVTTY